MHSESLYAERALRAGALGYINKDQATDKIVEAIQRVLAGNVWLSEATAERILHRTVGGKRKGAIAAPIEALADRELEVFRLIGRGERTAGIAAQLHLSVKTVETYHDRIRHAWRFFDGRNDPEFAVGITNNPVLRTGSVHKDGNRVFLGREHVNYLRAFPMIDAGADPLDLQGVIKLAFARIVGN